MSLNRRPPIHHAVRRIQVLLTLALILLGTQGCEQPPLVERLRAKGILRVATVAGPLSCYLGEKGPAGLEYDLVTRFARHLKLKPRIVVYPTRNAAIAALHRGEVEMAAGFIIPVPIDEPPHYLSSALVQTTASFAHFMGYKRFNPENMDKVPVTVPKGSYAEKLLEQTPVSLKKLENVAEETLLSQIDQGIHHYTLTNRAQLKAHRSILPRLVPGTRLEQPLGIRWLFARFYDKSLLNQANDFLRDQAGNGYLEELQSKYIDSLPKRNYVTRRDFWKHIEDRLPRYLDLFRQAGEKTGIDWRLLAAIGYQESHWKAKAKSPTGVRGIMMLTLDTARQQGIDSRLDPAQSILGGARHLLWVAKRIPERIQGDDRLWFTLASYNIGYGHLEDARILTERHGKNPDKWEDVKRHLPLLSKKKYYSTLKNGKARGGEPVAYVENIRYYYRLLVHWDNTRRGLDCTSPFQPRLARKN
ncbi:membrane-bound lytic murein transglycosylase MltF [Thiolapillus brandeum]|uniref:Transglycosylase n=1 Tax=Thiolapillus brandeum TaxID=1076588 RepID=A0A7U6JIN7_9GAMM|nr:membrane-bound lytic murein transglycosylase MltF [Thiolapillus brandeum]BAO45067.1 transglycosylase [Thiolapillus brandeum]